MKSTFPAFCLMVSFVLFVLAGAPAQQSDIVAKVKALMSEGRMNDAQALVSKDPAQSRLACGALAASLEQTFAKCPKDPSTGKAVVDGSTMELYMTAVFMAATLSESGLEQDQELLANLEGMREKYRLPDQFVTGPVEPEISHPLVGEWEYLAAGRKVTYRFSSDGTFLYQALGGGDGSLSFTMYDGRYAIAGDKVRLTGIRSGASATTTKPPTAEGGSMNTVGTVTRTEGGAPLPDRELEFSLTNGNRTLSLPDLLDSSRRAFTRSGGGAVPLTH